MRPLISWMAAISVYVNRSVQVVYHTRDSFFHVGRGRRDTLVKEYGRLDPRIADIVLDEMRANWWRHLLVSIPLGWCGMWVGWLWSLLLVPLFGWACACCPAVAAAVAAVRGACNRDAWFARGRSEPIHPL
jgi:hypothetical protein